MSLVDTIKAIESPGDVRERKEGLSSREANGKVTERDGYERICPEQPLYTPPEYYRRVAGKILGILAAASVLGMVIWYLLKNGEITL